MENNSLKREKLIIFTDGGSRGNPGPAAIGVVIGHKKYSQFIGKATNNFAEYQAIIFALKKVKQIYGSQKAKEIEIDLYADSELVINQLNGKYKIKDLELKDLFIEIWNLKQDFKKVNFNLIPREKNKEADKLVNDILDTIFS